MIRCRIPSLAQISDYDNEMHELERWFVYCSFMGVIGFDWYIVEYVSFLKLYKYYLL